MDNIIPCLKPYLVGGFKPTHPKNMRTVRLDHFPKFRGEHTKIFELPPPSLYFFGGKNVAFFSGQWAPSDSDEKLSYGGVFSSLRCADRNREVAPNRSQIMKGFVIPPQLLVLSHVHLVHFQHQLLDVLHHNKEPILFGL